MKRISPKTLLISSLNRVAADVSPLHFFRVDIGADSRRLQQERSSLGMKLFALLLFPVLLAGCGAKHEDTSGTASQLPTATVQVQTIEHRPHARTEAVVGTVQARLHATLEAKVSGHIEQLPVELGRRVKKGELVALLDDRDLKARLDQAEASQAQAESNWNRVSTLFHQQAATRAEYDDAQAQKRVTDATVAGAKAMLGYAKIVAPFDGVVTKKWADVGDLASPGKPLVDIEDPSQLRVQADVPDVIAAHVHEGGQMSVRVDALNQESTGTVAEISPAADPVTHTFRVKVNLPATPGLMSGQFARLEVPVGESDALLVPDQAVVERGQMEILFVVVNGHAQLRLVKTGRHIGDQVEILSGLDAGDVVVAGGASELTDGQPVEAR
ncbi:MAG TPA: efflux RND transporter periplasmic adaptor subunit [Verrucomicrobiae bacterium]|nr:efflux RND transporter periplasmic adaptor subunit [Verrucomicrobiae bacterium]